ncbi:hypothetical protein QI297_00445 [Staphylococcus saprophyticus]|nr:hypothetical protein [Staphylococcus saprophyticus]
MKIKRKVQKNLPQLIEWAMENDVTDRMFLTENSYCVGFDRHGFIYFNSSRTMPLYQTFIVEVEEVVDSNTVLDNVYTVNVEEGTSHTTYYKSKSINEVKTDEINIIYTILQEEAIVLWDSQGGFR